MRLNELVEMLEKMNRQFINPSEVKVNLVLDGQRYDHITLSVSCIVTEPNGKSIDLEVSE